MTTPEATAVEGVCPLPTGNIYFVLSYNTGTQEISILPIQDVDSLPRWEDNTIPDFVEDALAECGGCVDEHTLVLNDQTWCAYVDTVGEIIKAGKEAKPLTPLMPPTKERKTLDEVLKTIIK